MKKKGGGGERERETEKEGEGERERQVLSRGGEDSADSPPAVGTPGGDVSHFPPENNSALLAN